MQNRYTDLLSAAVLVPFVIAALSLLVLLAPLWIASWLTLAIIQIFAPTRLPSFLNESHVLMTSAAALTSGVRIVRGWLYSPAATLPVLDPPPSERSPARIPAARRKGEHGVTLEDLAALDAEGRFTELQEAVRSLIREDSVEALAHPTIKRWLGKRWRNLFLQHAASDPLAVAAASRRERFGLFNDSRPVAQRLAERFLKLPLPADGGVHEWQLVPGASPSVKPLPVGKPLPDLSESAVESERLDPSAYEAARPLPHQAAPVRPPAMCGASCAVCRSVSARKPCCAQALLFIPGIITGLLPVREFNPSMKHVQESSEE